MSINAVIAIDYGTSMSGYAWALAQTLEGNDLQIKDLSYVYLNADYVPLGGKDFSVIVTDTNGNLIPWDHIEPGSARKKHYIGREIYNLDLSDEQYFVHNRVKMDLYDPESNIAENINVSGNADPAQIYRELRGVKFYTLDLIAQTLRELSQRALEDIRARVGTEYQPQEIQWVITTPADATQLQKDAMREAARRAGMIEDVGDDNLIIVFEPEVAAIRIHCEAACRRLFER